MTEHEDRPAAPHDDADTPDEAMVSNPAEVIRLANMLQALLGEVREVDLDESGRRRIFEVQRNAVQALKDVVSADLEDELDQLGLPVEDEDASETELRIAHAQLVGWLNGLFQGLQAAMMAQQMGGAQQLQQLRQQRPELQSHHGGQYL